MPFSQPPYLPEPFAVSGLKNSIPTASASPLASLHDGFPAVNMQPVSSGGVPPDGKDMNGILYWISQISQWLQAGMLFTFDSTFATAIGGYPEGALVLSNDGKQVFRSMVASNTTDPNTLANVGTSWFPVIGEPTVGLARLATVTGTANALVLSSAITPAPMGGGAAIEQIVYFIPGSNNTGAVTLAVDSASPVALKRNDGSAMQADDLVGGTLYGALFDGTVWVMLTGVPSQSPAPAYASSEVVGISPTGTSSGTATMQGLACYITPTATGKLLMIVSGTIGNATTGDGGELNARFDTASGPSSGAPTNGAAVTGTLLGGTQRTADFPGASEVAPFSAQRIVSGLTVGQPYWFDLDLKAVGGGTCDLTEVTMSLVEIP